MLASDALSQQTNGRLNQQLDAEFQQRAGDIANDVGTRSAADGAAGFDANVLAQLNASDLMQNQYLDKRAGVVDGYLNISQKTQRDIQSINARTETSRQQRATQAAQIQQRYDQRTMDFRMANPVHRGSAPLFDYDLAQAADNAMWGAGRERAVAAENVMNGFVGLFSDTKKTSDTSTLIDRAAASTSIAQHALEANPRMQALSKVSQSLHQPVNVLRADLLNRVHTPLTNVAVTYAPVSNAKSLEILANLNNSTAYKGVQTAAKALPWAYGAAQIGEELVFANQNNLSSVETSLNVSSRALGTAAEVGAGTYVIGQTTAAGAAIGSIYFGVGALPGAVAGAVVGTAIYTFGEVGTAVNNFVTNSTRKIYGWFQ